MQKVAARLGISKMGVYRYVSSKEELLAVAVEQAVDVPPDADPTASWRDRTVAWAEALREVWLAHPWLPATTIGNRMVGPREIAWTEAGARALEGSRLAGGELRATIALLFAHARATLATDVAGTQYWNVAPELGAEIRERLRADQDRFPLVTAAEAATADGFDPWLYGLELILEGVAAVGRTRPPAG